MWVKEHDSNNMLIFVNQPKTFQPIKRQTEEPPGECVLDINYKG